MRGVFKSIPPAHQPVIIKFTKICLAVQPIDQPCHLAIEHCHATHCIFYISWLVGCRADFEDTPLGFTVCGISGSCIAKWSGWSVGWNLHDILWKFLCKLVIGLMGWFWSHSSRFTVCCMAGWCIVKWHGWSVGWTARHVSVNFIIIGWWDGGMLLNTPLMIYSVWHGRVIYS